MRLEAELERTRPMPPKPEFECAGCGHGYWFPKAPERCTRCGGFEFLTPRKLEKAADAKEELMADLRAVALRLEYAEGDGLRRTHCRKMSRARNLARQARRRVEDIVGILSGVPRKHRVPMAVVNVLAGLKETGNP